MKTSSKRRSNKRSKGILIILAFLLAAVVFYYIALCGIGIYGSGSVYNIDLGLDLAGGVSITYEIVDENPTATDIADTIYKLQLRVESYSTEAEVYQEGDDRIVVEIPGATDANEILEDLGEPGTLEFQDEDGNVLLTGDYVESASVETDSSDSTAYVVVIEFNDEGAEIFEEITGEMIDEIIYIVYDGEIVSAPTVSEQISGGSCQIDGLDSYSEANELATTIRIGALPLELSELRSNVVGAKLGSEAISTSIMAGIIGFIIICVLMIALYWVMGVVAAAALAFYVALVIVCLSSFGITLTLPGIAGIILSIGMAVDANVIIFERIREEIASGHNVRVSIKEGFSKAMSAIVDGNVTTLIAAVVLLWRGSGSVKGFAQTLALGIVLSMFTALVVTRLLINAVYDLGIKDAKFYGKAKPPKKFNYLKKRFVCMGVSLAVIVIGFVSMAVYSMGESGSILNFGLEFSGGTSTTVTFEEDLDLETIQSDIVPLIEDITGDSNVQVQKVSGSTEVIFKTRTLTVEERQELTAIFVDEYDIDEDTIETTSISATISSEMKSDAVIAVIIATILMLLYIWFRFSDLRFAASSVIALVHDVLVVLAFYAVFRWSVGNTFIACMLTIVGYSINATIVIFDRIRENQKKMNSRDELADVVNLSINQTLHRSIYTSATTFVMVLVLYIFGVSSIREFALPLMVGILCGAYSSVFLAGSLWYIMKTKIGGKKASGKAPKKAARKA